MDEFIGFIILMILLTVFERIMRAAQKKKTPASESPEEEGAEVSMQTVGKDIQDLIAEELGINLERRPSVEKLPGPETRDERDELARRHPTREDQPTREGFGTETPAPTAQRATAQQPRALQSTTQQPIALPPEVKPPERGLQREELGAASRAAATERERDQKAEDRKSNTRERGYALQRRSLREVSEPKSLEVPRRPEDHDRFHERYGVPQPVRSHKEFHDRYVDAEGRPAVRRRSPTVLPDRLDWSAAQKAIIWAEILGPPKGLSEE